MPTISRIDGFRFFFYSNEGNEPSHIHVEKGGQTAKYWLEPVSKQYSYLSPAETRKVKRLVIANQQLFLDAWNEYFGN